MTSLPRRPTMTSLRPVPTSRSSPAVPTIVGVRPKQFGGRTARADDPPKGGSMRRAARRGRRRRLRMGMQGVEVGSVARGGPPLLCALHRGAFAPLVKGCDELVAGSGGRHLSNVLGEGAEIALETRVRFADLPESGGDRERIRQMLMRRAGGRVLVR